MVHFLAQVLYDYIIVSTLDLIDYGFANRKEYVPVSGGTDFFIKLKEKKLVLVVENKHCLLIKISIFQEHGN